MLVSIHAPVMDAIVVAASHGRLLSFNPRARDGRDFGVPILCAADAVSIHAPVMDAIIFGLMLSGDIGFQSTRP